MATVWSGEEITRQIDAGGIFSWIESCKCEYKWKLGSFNGDYDRLFIIVAQSK